MAWQALKDVWAPPNAPCSQLWGLGLDKDIRTSQFNSQLRTDLVAEHRVVIRIAGEEKQRRGLLAYGSVQRGRQPETGSTMSVRSTGRRSPHTTFQSTEPGP